LGCIVALTAIGGETWRPNKLNLWKKITPRGWLALCCLILALFLGIVKEIKSNAAADRAEKDQVKLQNKLDSLKIRMEIVDKRLIEYSQENTIDSSPHKSIDLSKKIGNVAGYVKDGSGKIVPFVMITRIASNAQTNSHKDGDFVVESVHEGETLKFQKDGYEALEYKVKPPDFMNLVEITIKKEE
jgi:hypothetical protein